MEGLPITPWTVFLYALLTAVATGLGALPFLFTRGITPRHLGLANAAAAGLMVAASFGLIYEGVNYSLGRTLVGVGLGLLFILLAHRYLEEGPVRGVQGKGLGQGVLDEPDGEGPVPLPGQGGEEAEVARPPRGGGVGEEGEGPLQPVRVLGLKEGLPSPHPGPEVQPFPL